MTTRATTLLLTSVLALSTASASAGSALPGFTLAAETPRVSYYTRDGLKVDVKRTERYLNDLERKLGVKVDRRASFYRYDYPEQIAALTGQHAAGLTQVEVGRIHSTEAFHAHELVHWVAGQLGDPGAFFHEGLAVALSSGGRWRGHDLDDVARAALTRYDLATIVRSFREIDAEIAYPVAGAFVAHLIDEYGLEQIVELFRSSAPPTPQRRAIRSESPDVAAFGRTFGVSFDAALARWSQRS